MQKMLKLILCTNLLSTVGFCTTVSSTVDIQNSNLNLSRETTVTDSGKIIIQGNSSFTQNDKTLQNNGIIDIAGYTNDSSIFMSITGQAEGSKGLILGKADDSDPVCIDPYKIESIIVAPDQTVHYYYAKGTTQYTIADALAEGNLIQLDSKTTDEIGVDKESYTNVSAFSAGEVKWQNDGPDAGEDINVTITIVATNSDKNLTENTLDLTTQGLDPVLDSGSPSVNVKLTGNASITFKGSSENISSTDKFEFAGDNSELGIQTLPANATMIFTGSDSLFSHNAITEGSDIGELVFGDGKNASENSISNDIRTKKLTINTSAKLTIDSEKSLIITGDGSNINGTIEITNGGSIVF